MLLPAVHVLRAALPDDLLWLLRRTCAAQRLQRSFRGTVHRHYSARREWPQLRRLLVHRSGGGVLAILQGSQWVRHEWRVEPESWLYMLRHEAHQLPLICRDVEAGEE